jgi:hypothetical protein
VESDRVDRGIRRVPSKSELVRWNERLSKQSRPEIILRIRFVADEIIQPRER